MLAMLNYDRSIRRFFRPYSHMACLQDLVES